MTNLTSLRPHAALLGLIDQDIAEEKAGTLVRLTKAFETAVVAYHALPADISEVERTAATKELADALYHLLVHREALGLRDTERLMRDYQVPSSVRAFMGVVPKDAS